MGKGRVATQLENRENVIKVLDTKIALEDAVQDEMIKVLRIATLCTTKLPNLRPSMKEVVNMLVDAEPSTFKSGNRKYGFLADAWAYFMLCAVVFSYSICTIRWFSYEILGVYGPSFISQVLCNELTSLLFLKLFVMS
nr:receptor-like protein kinase HAIKU2 [Ipomoea trifida]